jgi:CheY-like chemotaxis protein
MTSPSRSGPRKILVVDDSTISSEFVRMVLEGFGHTVLSMESHFGFVKTLQTEKPDLVLVDVTMPILSGPKLVELALKKRNHRCHIVLYSDRSEEELSKLAVSCGADGFIRKTADEALFVQSVARFLFRPQTKS